jgi:hypothetical protein
VLGETLFVVATGDPLPFRIAVIVLLVLFIEKAEVYMYGVEAQVPPQR